MVNSLGVCLKREGEAPAEPKTSFSSVSAGGFNGSLWRSPTYGRPRLGRSVALPLFGHFKHALLILLSALVAFNVSASFADDISGEVDGKKFKKSGTVKFENDELVILETSDGAWHRLPKAAIEERVASPAPPFQSAKEIGATILGDQAANPRIRVRVTPDVIVVLTLETELPAEHDERAEKVLTQMVKSYTQAAEGVKQFAKKFKFPQKKPATPALIMVYESESLAVERQGEDSDRTAGVSALMDCGWYEPGRNQASFSLPEVLGWEGTVADVLVWQQLFHTGMLKRHAPIPLWFLQGLASGFDSTPTRVEAGHHKLSSTTFPGLQEAKLVNWDKMACDYDFYLKTEDFTFEDFRDQAWALHWYLINKNKAAYTKYWKMMADLSPLDSYDTEKAQATFKKAFGKDPEAFKPLFEKAFETASRTPPPPLHPDDAFWYWMQDFGSVKMTWIDEAVENGEVRMHGTLTNSSPLRTRSFCVGFTTTRGKSAVWFVDKLEPLKSVELKAMRAVDPAADKEVKDKAEKQDKAVKKAPTEGPPEPDDVWIKSALPDSPDAEKWRKGELPLSDDE